MLWNNHWRWHRNLSVPPDYHFGLNSCATTFGSERRRTGRSRCCLLPPRWYGSLGQPRKCLVGRRFSKDQGTNSFPPPTFWFTALTQLPFSSLVLKATMMPWFIVLVFTSTDGSYHTEKVKVSVLTAPNPPSPNDENVAQGDASFRSPTGVDGLFGGLAVFGRGGATVGAGQDGHRCAEETGFHGSCHGGVIGHGVRGAVGHEIFYHSSCSLW